MLADAGCGSAALTRHGRSTAPAANSEAVIVRGVPFDLIVRARLRAVLPAGLFWDVFESVCFDSRTRPLIVVTACNCLGDVLPSERVGKIAEP